MMRKVINKIAKKIIASKSFLITAHVNLEGDALGSELAVYTLLRKLKKRVVIYNNDPTPPIYRFLPNIGVIKNTLGEDKFDVALVLDCSDASRSGGVQDYLSRAGCIINIDHHISNTFFGEINWVEPNSSSVCEMLYKLCDRFQAIDAKIALCLYTGIFTDTGNFTFGNTTGITHKIVSNLMNYKIPPHQIYAKLRSLCAHGDLKFIGGIISSLRFDSRRKICWAMVKKWEEKDYDLTEVIFSIMRLLRGVEVFILFKRLGRNKIRVNFRSRSSVNVNRIAQFFGGGGHKRASGTTIEGSLAAVEKKVIAFVRRYTNKLTSSDPFRLARNYK